MGHVADAVACLGRVLSLCGPNLNRVAATYHCDVPGGDRQPRPMGLYVFDPPDHTTRRTGLDRFFIMGLLNNAIPFSLIVWGQTQISSSQALILNATTPIFTVLVAHLFTRDERITMRHVLGTGLGFTGVVFLMGESVFGGVGASLMAQAALLGAAISYAFSVIFGRRFRSMGVAPMQIATGKVTAAAVLLLPLVVLVDRPWRLSPPGSITLLADLGLALVSTAFAYACISQSWHQPAPPICRW